MNLEYEIQEDGRVYVELVEDTLGGKVVLSGILDPEQFETLEQVFINSNTVQAMKELLS